MLRATNRPADLFDRTQEWDDLTRFATDPSPGISVALVYGRRRQGKSYLLRRLAQRPGGFYHQALEVETVQALQGLGEKLGAHIGVEPLALRTWDDAIATLTSLAVRTPAALGTFALGTAPLAGPTVTGPGVAILDEFPYFLEKDASLPSIIQRVVDASQDGATPPVRLILCGSALSVMEDLFEGPLRGRIQTQVVVQPFTYREFAQYWGFSDPNLAFRVHAVLGGTPGYKGLVRSAPKKLADFASWVVEEVLSPSSALFNEDEFLLGEERTLSDRSLYHSVLAAVAGGASTEAQIAASVGRNQTGVQHPLRELVRTGFVSKSDDLLRRRRPIYRIAEPIMRFLQVVKNPDLSRFEDRQGSAAWVDAQSRFDSQILSPHFEDLVREYVAHFAPVETTGEPVGKVGAAVISDPQGKAQHEIDVVALAPGSTANSPIIQVLGESKLRKLGIGDLQRLEHIRDLLNAPASRLLLSSAGGFEAPLVSIANGREDVGLVGLQEMFSAV
jgi:AAA+ ATPase superfamily predicted ATPase